MDNQWKIKSKKQIAVPCPKCGDMFTDHDVFYDHVAAHINSHLNLSKPKETTIPIPSVDESIAEVTVSDGTGTQKIYQVQGREALSAIDNENVSKPSDSESQVPKYSYRVPQTSMQAAKAVPDVQKPSTSSKISVIHHSVLMNPEALTLSSKVSGLSELPPSLRGQVKFPCKVDTCAPGGGSLYRAAAGHLKLGQEGWLALRRYCHGMMLEWWQWYQPYFTFPCQVKIVYILFCNV